MRFDLLFLKIGNLNCMFGTKMIKMRKKQHRLRNIILYEKIEAR